MSQSVVSPHLYILTLINSKTNEIPLPSTSTTTLSTTPSLSLYKQKQLHFLVKAYIANFIKIQLISLPIIMDCIVHCLFLTKT